MVKFINKTTGGVMWVDEKRTEEYKAAGHVPTDQSVKPAAKKGTRKK